MGLWLKTGIVAAMEITLHSITRITDNITGTAVIGMIVAMGKETVRMVIESVYSPLHSGDMTA